MKKPIMEKPEKMKMRQKVAEMKERGFW